MGVLEDEHSVTPGAPDVLHRLLDAARLESRGIDLGRPGISDGNEALTFGEYADAVARFARVLTDLEVGRGDRVGVHLHKSVHSFIAVHAVLRAGGVMVPLDPLSPVPHVGAVLADARADVVVTDVAANRLSALVESSGVRSVVTRSTVPDEVHDALSGGVSVLDWHAVERAEPGPAAHVGPDDPAYIIYTSGSTGRPKGIVHTHRSALAYAALAASVYELSEDDRLANVASLHFDQSTFELYAAPLVGAMVLVIPDAVLRFPASVTELIEHERPTVWYSVPFVLRQLAQRGALDRRDLSSLRWVLFGGEVFPPGELGALMRQIPSARFSNVYGPAEVNQCAHYNLDEPPPPDEPVPIGRAWRDIELAVVDAELQPVAAGEQGELVVAASTMMDGYWDRPDLTASAIIEAGLGRSEPQRWYRTGDLVRVRTDGELVFLGRADNQVKLRGQRIELEAVEVALLDVDGVHEGGVVVEHSDEGDQLVAVVVVEDGTTAQMISRDLAARLPRAGVPTAIIPVSTLPRTRSGKLDRNALLDDLTTLRASESAHNPESTTP